MADNVAITAGSGTTIAADDVSSVYFQKIKVDAGGDGVSVPIVAGQQAMAASLPVVVASNQTAIPVSDGSSTLSIDDGAGSITVDGTVAISGTVAVQDNASQVDDAAFTPATSRVLMIGAEFDNVATDSVDEGDGGALRMSANRNLYVNIRDSAGNERGLNVDASGNIGVTDAGATLSIDDGAGSITVDGTVAVSGTVTVDSELPAAAALADAAANPNTPTAGSATLVFNGTTWDRARGDTSNGLDVDVTRVSGNVAVTLAAGATAIAKAEDVASADADVGVPAMAVRKATPANTSGTDGDYEMLQMSAGRLWTSTVVDTALPAGTNAIGKLAANSGVDIGDVDVLTLPARAATTDTITAKLATDAIQNGTTALTPKFAAIAAASSGDNTLVSAVVGKKIRVLQLFILAAGAVNVYFTSAAGGTVIFGGSTNKINLAANGGFVLPFSPIGWFENSTTNQALIMNLSGAVVVSGGLVYVEV